MTTGYVVSSTMESNSTYVITSGTKIMTAGGSSISSSDLTTINDTSGNVYIPSSCIATNALWTYDGSKIKNYSTNTYLSAYKKLELGSKNNSNWSYNDNKLSSSEKNSKTYYIYLNENNFTCNTNKSSDIVLYKLSNDIVTDNYK